MSKLKARAGRIDSQIFGNIVGVKHRAKIPSSRNINCSDSFLNLKVLIGRYALISLNSLRNLTQCRDQGFEGAKGSSKKSSFRPPPDT